IGVAVFMPRLIARLGRDAPYVRLKTVSLLPRESEEALESGEVDVSVGYFPDLIKAGFYQQRLFRHSFACMARADHPKLPGCSLTQEQFLSLPHAVVRAQGRCQEVFENFLHQRGIRRNVVFQTPHFMSLPMVIAESDLIATVPCRLAAIFSGVANVKSLPLPFDVPEFDLRQYWHKRFHRDAGHVWLRNTIRDLFADSLQGPAVN